MSGVPDRGSGRKESDSKVEPERCRDHGDAIDRHAFELTPLQATDSGMGEPDDRADRSLAESGRQTGTAQLLAGPLSLSTAHTDPTLPDAVMRSHGVIMGASAYPAITTPPAPPRPTRRRPPVSWSQERSDGRSNEQRTSLRR